MCSSSYFLLQPEETHFNVGIDSNEGTFNKKLAACDCSGKQTPVTARRFANWKPRRLSLSYLRTHTHTHTHTHPPPGTVAEPQAVCQAVDRTPLLLKPKNHTPNPPLPAHNKLRFALSIFFWHVLGSKIRPVGQSEQKGATSLFQKMKQPFFPLGKAVLNPEDRFLLRELGLVLSFSGKPFWRYYTKPIRCLKKCPGCFCWVLEVASAKLPSKGLGPKVLRNTQTGHVKGTCSYGVSLLCAGL